MQNRPAIEIGGQEMCLVKGRLVDFSRRKHDDNPVGTPNINILVRSFPVRGLWLERVEHHPKYRAAQTTSHHPFYVLNSGDVVHLA
jgi:hypothetical protein